MMSSQNAKYYLGFLFEPKMRDGLHCTHCYFGTLNAASLERVVEVVSDFYRHFGLISLEQPIFSEPALFGPDKNIPVLKAQNPNVFAPMKRLRDVFAGLGMISTEFPFTPHVTTTISDCVSKRVVGYALVRSGEVLRVWPIGNYDC